MTGTLLDHVYDDLINRPGTIDAALAALSWHLRTLKRQLPTQHWQHTIGICREHPLRELLHQDPLTARAFAMSRGYQGDAELLDIIYSSDFRPFRDEPTTVLGEAIFKHTIRCQAPTAVRERRIFLASQIDACCAATASAHILSVACGHLRELEISNAIQTRSHGRFVGIDQDPATLAFVESVWGPHGVEAKRASIKSFLSDGAPPSERYDFIYVAGLYDYLEEKPARHVTAKLFAKLRPAGRLLIGNYTPETEDAGYMEAYMGWNLLYRDSEGMHRLASEIPPPAIAAIGTLSDTTGAVCYLDIKTKA
jgi:hypothetical protein